MWKELAAQIRTVNTAANERSEALRERRDRLTMKAATIIATPKRIKW
jgi:hypothetical protein